MAQTLARNLPRLWATRSTFEVSKLCSNFSIQRKNVFTTSELRGIAGRPVNMPSLSPTMTEGTIVKWLKKEGDTIAPGDVLCEIQTDKAVVSMDTEEEGVLAKILVQEDIRDIKVGTLIALMVEEGEDYTDVEIPQITTATEESSQGVDVSTKQPLTDQTKLKIGPAAKNLLDLYGLNSSEVPASGPRHTLSKSDVLQYVELKNLKPAEQKISSPPPPPTLTPAPIQASAPAPIQASAPLSENTQFSDIEVSNMRRTIAKRLTQSKTTIPHAYSSITCSMENIINLRNKLKGENIKVSVNDFIIKSAAIALKRVPEANAQWTEKGTITFLSEVDISVAVATDSGLITPIVKDASSLGVETISSTVKELAGRARIGKLKPEEFMGGSFSISNLGMFGISEFSAVINPPQAAILAIGTSELIPVEVAQADGEKKIMPRNVMTSTLSYDSRVITEEAAVRFMRVFKENMEDPYKNLLDGPKSEAKIAVLL